MLTKISVAAGVAALVLFNLVGMAYATPAFDPSAEVIGGGTSTVTELQETFTGLLPVVIPLMAAFIGWRIVRRLVKSNAG